MDLGDIDGASCNLSSQDCDQDDSSDLQGTPSALDQLRAAPEKLKSPKTGGANSKT